MLGHKASLNTFKKIEIISNIFSDQSGMKLQINNRKKTWKIHKYREINQHTLEQPMDQRRNQEISESILKQMKMKTYHSKTYGMQQNSSKREVYRDKCLNLEERSQINNFTLQGIFLKEKLSPKLAEVRE